MKKVTTFSKWLRKRTQFQRRALRILFFILGSFLTFLALNLIFPLKVNIDYSTVITDNKGEMINAYLTIDDKWRMRTSLDEISPLLRKTILAKEDKYFYSHPGINPIAVGRAMLSNIFHGKRTSGASTITMQVARMLSPKSRTVGNKIIEMFRAMQLEWKYSKDEILQLYLNLVPYGGNIEGVKAAALLYFDKNPDHLSLAEITALSIIPNRPSSLRIGESNDLILQERNKWLHRFQKAGVFPEMEIRNALAEPLDAYRRSVPHYAPHLSQKLRQQYPKTTIQSYVDLNTQWKAEKMVKDYMRTWRLHGVNQAAVIILDNHSNRVISYVGSTDFYDSTDAGQVNGASAVRQPGSTLKSLLYALCIDNGLLTPRRIISDVPVNYRGYAPENYDRQFNGDVTMAYSLEHSLNIPAVKSLALLGKDRMIRQLAACNFEQIGKDRRKLGLSLILGGCGSTLEELCGMFSMFAHNGKYNRPLYCTDERDGGGRVICSEASSYMISEILSKVDRPDFPLSWSATEHLPRISWKTGTSYGRRDAWSIGYNLNYTIAVWVGNFSGRGVPELSGANVATPLLFRLFNTVDYNNNGDWFSAPPELDYRKVCTETGMPPSDHCEHVALDEYIPLVSATKACDHFKEILVSADERISYCPSCAPATGYKRKWYPVISPEMQAWMEDHGRAFVKPPPHNPDCPKIFRDQLPVITSPVTGTEYYINKRDPEPLQLSCRAGTDASKLYWYINDHFFKVSAPEEKLFFVPPEGKVKISCTDDKGRNRDCWITVKLVDL